MSPGPTGARLRIGARNLPAHILDASSGGYLIEVEGTPRAKLDQPVELITESGGNPLRVVWHHQTNRTTSMGLQHVSEELPWRQDTSWVIWMLVAVIMGLGLGAFVALGENTQLHRELSRILQTMVS